MSIDAENADLGFYVPGVFHLELVTHEQLTDFNRLAANAVSAELISTFLHEYIHFLQDVTSTQGLLNFINYVEYLKNANQQVRDSTQAEFKTPIKISNAFEHRTNEKLLTIYYGGRDDAESISYSHYEEIKMDLTTNGSKTISVPKYRIHYFDNRAQSKNVCHFGSLHIKEYMAHAVQKAFSPNRNHFDIPYVLVELIIKKEHPPLSVDASFMLAVCDAVLMHYHPAHLFFDVLKRMKQDKWVPENVESVYGFVFDGLRLSWEDQAETIGSLHRKTASSAMESFRDALKADIYRENVQWFEHVVTEALDLRMKHQGFFGKLVDSPGNFSLLFQHIIDGLGIPFMTNAVGHGYFLAPVKLKALNIQPYFPKVFQAIRKTYMGEEGCLLHSYCETRPDKKVTNGDCLKRPWERVNLPELCPYAQIWKTWGLIGKKPVPTSTRTA